MIGKENTTTFELSSVLTELNIIEETNVYGVPVAGSDGRAGMAAVLLVERQETTPFFLTDICRVTPDHYSSDCPEAGTRLAHSKRRK
ncbi:hypothetical protein ScPMuIL_017806 [Solemya velum]